MAQSTMVTKSSIVNHNLVLVHGKILSPNPARVNQQPPMQQLAVLFTGRVAFFHSAPDGVHLSPFLFTADHYTFLFFGSLAVFP
jgi:hypothetical protein